MKKTIITLIVILAIAGSVGAYLYTRPGPEPKVSTATVGQGDIVESVGATGTLDAVTSVNVGSQVSGIIKELGADFNQIVKKGQVILRIDPDAIQTQLEQQKANLVRAQADVERLKVTLEDAQVKAKRSRELFAKKLVTQSDLDTAEVNVKAADAQLKSSQAALVQAQAQVSQQEVNLAHTIITAPIDGIIVQRAVDVGQTVQSNFQSPTLFIIAADLTKMKCTANIDESDVSRIRTGQHVTFRVDGYPNETFNGTVVQVRLQPTVVQNVVTYATVIEVPNPDFKLKPGMTANVQIEIAKKTNVLKVPNAAIRFRPSTDLFAALNQPVPPELQRGQGRGGQGAAGGSGTAQGGGTNATPGAPAGQNAAAGQNGQRPAAGQAPAQANAAPQGGQRGQQAGATPATTPQGGQGGAFQRGGGDRPQGMGGGERPQGMGGQGMASGEGRGFGGGGRGGDFMNDPERRARMMERFQQMPADQREQFLARMKERGVDVSEFTKAMGGAKAAAGRPAGGAVKADAGTTNAIGVQTIDSLFGPLPPRVSFGRAWVYTAGTKELKSIRLRLGITDGQYTELLDGDLKVGQELVTGILLGTEAKTGAGGAQSPLMQQQRGPMGPMGGPGGGRGR